MVRGGYAKLLEVLPLVVSAPLAIVSRSMGIVYACLRPQAKMKTRREALAPSWSIGSLRDEHRSGQMLVRVTER